MDWAAQQAERWFDVAGRIDAPAIVLVHGAVITRKMWLRQLRGLSDMYFVVAADLPGHGALAQMPFTFAAAVQTLADVIARETRGRALVVGLSLGGHVAMELARCHPDLVTGLVLVWKQPQRSRRVGMGSEARGRRHASRLGDTQPSAGGEEDAAHVPTRPSGRSRGATAMRGHFTSSSGVARGGRGHACSLDQPEHFNEAVRKFAQSLPALSALRAP